MEAKNIIQAILNSELGDDIIREMLMKLDRASIDKVCILNKRMLKVCNSDFWFKIYKKKYKNDMNTILMEASKDGRRELVKSLLKLPPKAGIDVAKYNKSYIINFKQAAQSGELKTIIGLLKSGFPERWLASKNIIYSNALSESSQGGHFNVFEYILKNTKVDPNKDYGGGSPLGSALSYGEPKILLKLLKYPEIDPNYGDNFKKMVELIQNDYSEEPMIFLNDKRVDPSQFDNIAIISASSAGGVDMVKKLIKDPRVDPSAQKNKAIKKAINYDHSDVVELLLEDKRVVEKSNTTDLLNLALWDYDFDEPSTETVLAILSSPKIKVSKNLILGIIEDFIKKNGNVGLLKTIIKIPRVNKIFSGKKITVNQLINFIKRSY